MLPNKLNSGKCRKEDVDVLDATPLIDIKPYVPRFDAPPGAGEGWIGTVDPEQARKRGRRQGRGGQMTAPAVVKYAIASPPAISHVLRRNHVT